MGGHLSHGQGHQQLTDEHDVPTPNKRRPPGGQAISEEAEDAGGGRDKGKGDGEIGEKRQIAAQFLAIPELFEIFGVFIRQT